MLNFKDLEEMKKVFLFCVVALAFASCAKKAETAPAVDSAAVAVDTAAVDTAAVADSTATDSVK